jgi:hypothetical protein
VQITVGNIRKCLTILVFGSMLNFHQSSPGFAFFGCCSQSSQIWRQFKDAFVFDVLLVDSKITMFHDVSAAWGNVHHRSIVVSFMRCDQSTYPKAWLPFLFNSHASYIFDISDTYPQISLHDWVIDPCLNHSHLHGRVCPSEIWMRVFSPTLRNCFSMEWF